MLGSKDDSSGVLCKRQGYHLIFTHKCTKHLLFPWQTDQVNPGESYDPLLMSLVKSTSISVDEGWGNRLKKFLCMCTIQRMNGQDKIFKCLWMGYGSRCQVHRFVSTTATLLGFSHWTVSCVSRMVQNPKDIQPTWHNCGKHWSQHGASIPVECFQQLGKFQKMMSWL